MLKIFNIASLLIIGSIYLSELIINRINRMKGKRNIESTFRWMLVVLLITIVNIFNTDPYKELENYISIVILFFLMYFSFAVYSGYTSKIYFSDNEDLQKTISNVLRSHGYTFSVEESNDKHIFKIDKWFQRILLIPSRRLKDDTIKYHTITFRFMGRKHSQKLYNNLVLSLKDKEVYRENKNTLILGELAELIIAIVAYSFAVYIMIRG